MKNLEKLLPAAKDFELRIDVIVTITKVRFEATQVFGEGVMNLQYWNETCDNMFSLFSTMKQKPEFQLKEGFVEESREADQSDFKVQTNIMGYLELLDMFLTIGLKGEEPRSAMYVLWLKNEVRFLELAEMVLEHYRRSKVLQAQTRVAIIILDRLHYKSDSLLRLMREKGNAVTKKEYYLEQNMRKKIEDLANLVYEHGTDTQKIRAALYQIFHHCLHGRYHEGRDLFLYSRMSQQHLHEIKLQIYYNRALAELGLAAFQCGYTESVLECLGDMVATARLRELLAQGVSGRKEKSTKQDQEEAKRLLPYHMHISTDLVEAAYLISAMLTEVPFVAKQRHNIPEHGATRHFRRVMQEFERRNV